MNHCGVSSHQEWTASKVVKPSGRGNLFLLTYYTPFCILLYMATLTEKQQEVLDWICEQIQQGASPTLAELSTHFGCAFHTGIACHLVALERKGFITREPRKARSIRISTPISTTGATDE